MHILIYINIYIYNILTVFVVLLVSVAMFWGWGAGRWGRLPNRRLSRDAVLIKLNSQRLVPPQYQTYVYIMCICVYIYM